MMNNSNSSRDEGLNHANELFHEQGNSNSISTYPLNESSFTGVCEEEAEQLEAPQNSFERQPQQHHQHHRNNSGNGLPHFNMQHQDAISPSSSLVEQVDENDYVMHSPTMDSLHVNTNELDSDGIQHLRTNTQPPPPPPSEQTAREQLIERERQGRLERERARLKRRLAISRERDEEDEAFAEVDRLRESVEENSMDIMNLTDIDEDDEGAGENDRHVHDENPTANDAPGTITTNDMNMLITTDGNVHMQDDTMQNDIAHGSEGGDSSSDPNLSDGAAATGGNSASLPLGFTMERFLQDGVVVSTSSNLRGPPGASPSIEAEDSNIIQETVMTEEIIANPRMTNGGHDNDDNVDNDSNTNHELVDLVSEDPNSSMAAISVTAGVGPSSEVLSTSPVSRGASSHIGIADLASSIVAGTSSNRPERDDNFMDNAPRLARLTEAEILDLANIDYASVGNMPPRSERDDQDLAGLGRMSNIGSEITHTTMQESMSVVSADMNIDIIQNDDNDVFHTNTDFTGEADPEIMMANESQLQDENRNITKAIDQVNKSNDSVNMNHFIISGASSSIQSTEESAHNDQIHNQHNHHNQQNDNNLKMPARFSDEETESNRINSPKSSYTDEKQGYRINLENGEVETSNDVDASIENYNLPNRVIRPGFIKVPSHQNSSENSSLHRRSFTAPNMSNFVDDFDYCKYNDQGTPNSLEEEIIQPYNKNSPFNSSDVVQYGSIAMNSTSRQYLGTEKSSNRHSLKPHIFFGVKNNHDDIDLSKTMESDDYQESFIASHHDNGNDHSIEEQLLLHKNNFSKKNGDATVLNSRTDGDSIKLLGSILRSVELSRTNKLETEDNDCDIYLASNAITRAFPERFLALILTLIIEIPVLLIISGGSDQLCALIGRKRYQLLMAFLPLSSAISGNCGLQASTLSTRAISHFQVTEKNYFTWLCTELKAASLLGIAIGLVIGIIAFQASGFDFSFGFTIFVANFISVLTAGLTGTLAPLLFTFLFKCDSGKWGGPIETAIQDIVGSFVMVILSYRMLSWIGPKDIDPSDLCGSN